ncbi:hypothetical protein C8Q80DRAFT_111949 [Daedaleopsis nitida]|nr:hypothetical protein C8Q80DRAFT_111949 [Daedaleopsis nitida]
MNFGASLTCSCSVLLELLALRKAARTNQSRTAGDAARGNSNPPPDVPASSKKAKAKKTKVPLPPPTTTAKLPLERPRGALLGGIIAGASCPYSASINVVLVASHHGERSDPSFPRDLSYVLSGQNIALQTLLPVLEGRGRKHTIEISLRQVRKGSSIGLEWVAVNHCAALCPATCVISISPQNHLTILNQVPSILRNEQRPAGCMDALILTLVRRTRWAQVYALVLSAP